ncbi:efflux RND transporter periplasmic adaptor subunit [Saccharicrinis fermentans]|uniref:Multidrug resistance protein MdtN n=1 Tax=Saccharicrinis fermentans DSM 9555 = JCM 21142 TaxID=869213 RepID=W7YBD3_9BACT|nr:HlyD family efflux transporter periplasmic adaptor subunit [Saccharicrinis fermentans]GAF05752.1 multidrug resistance protein MdtN [Saccharicrinis fermentans DSM 9555 = JCM 21142]
MKTKFFYGLLSVLLIAIAIGVSGFLIKTKPVPKKDETKHNEMYVKTDQVKYVDVKADMTYRGRVTAYDNVSLAAEVSGRIMKGDVRFKAGERFRKGDVIVRIYSEDIQASLKSGKSSFLQTLSTILPDLKVDYPQEFEKWNNFFKAVDPARGLPDLPEANSDKEKVFLASTGVLSGYYSLQQQEIQLKRYTIRAPFNGSFKTVSKEIGAVASPGSELATIICSDKLEVVVPVFPSDLKWMKKGDEVKISNIAGIEESAIISRISDFIVDQSVNVYLSYDASGKNNIIEGAYVDAVFSGTKVPGFEIPREAIVDKSFVYELVGNKLQKTPIEIIRQLEDMTIISGVEESKLIVTESLASVNPNMEYLPR